MRARLLAEGQTGRYLRYAFGEMVLVIAGILIALQLNTANERRIDHQRLVANLQALVNDLQADLVMLEPIHREMANVRERVHFLGDYVRDRSPEELDNLDLYFLMRAPYYRPYTWNRAGIEQLKSSGALARMRDRGLATRISAYAALQGHLEDDYLHDREIAVRALALANRVVNMNYPSLEDVITIGELSRVEPLVDWEVGLQSSRLHQGFEGVDLEMLSRDATVIGEAVNAYQEIVDAYGLWPRFVIEMPGLERTIQALMDDLIAEFGLSPPELTELPVTVLD